MGINVSREKQQLILFWIGLLVCFLSVVVAIWLAGWVCFIGGIVTIVEGIKANPVNGYLIGWGALKFVLTGIVGWASFGIGFVFGLTLVHASR